MTLHKTIDLQPIAGTLIGEVISGDYETSSGILVVQDLKKGNWPRKVRIVALGGPFYDSSENEVSYSAEPGDIAWIRKQSGKPFRRSGKEHLNLDNQFIVAVERDGRMIAPADMVIVEPRQEDKIGLIEIPETSRESYRGVVLSVGNRYPWALAPGDRVVYRANEGTPVEFKGVKYLSLKSKWVEAVEN